MILYHAPRSPYSLKVRIVVHELGWSDRVRFATIDPWREEALRAHNPLCKVPTLVFPDGGALYDSRAICEHLAEEAGGGFLGPAPGRLAVRRLHALADGLSEAVIRRHVEGLGPSSDRSDGVIRRQELAIAAALDMLDGAASGDLSGPPTLAQAAVVASLTYLNFRSPELAWRRGRDRLGRWFEAASAAPAVLAAGFPLPAGP